MDSVDYWTTGMMDYWTVDYWTADYWTTGLVDYWTTGLPGHWATRPLDYYSVDSVDSGLRG